MTVQPQEPTLSDLIEVHDCPVVFGCTYEVRMITGPARLRYWRIDHCAASWFYAEFLQPRQDIQDSLESFLRVGHLHDERMQVDVVGQVRFISSAPDPTSLEHEAAYALALKVLGKMGTEQVYQGIYEVPSRLSDDVRYLCGPDYVRIWRGKNMYGTLCLQAAPQYPMWDAILSRIFMLKYDEALFLRTANFWNAYTNYNAVPRPMSRDRVQSVFGMQALIAWEESHGS